MATKAYIILQAGGDNEAKARKDKEQNTISKEGDNDTREWDSYYTMRFL